VQKDKKGRQDKHRLWLDGGKDEFLFMKIRLP
jgi:hypothetical protein